MHMYSAPTMDAANSNRNPTCVPLGTEGTGYYTTHAVYAGATSQLVKDKVFALIGKGLVTQGG